MFCMDTNEDGSIGVDEWLAFMQKLGLEYTFRKAVATRWSDPVVAFKVLDVDGDGSLQLEELQV